MWYARGMSTKHVVIGLVLLAIVGGVSYYAISPIFRIRVANDPLPAGATSGIPMPTSTAQAASSTPAAPMPAVAMIGATPVPVAGTFAHPASGTVRVVGADGKSYVRYENFKTLNGPDIFVYLATDENASDFVNLGPVKATEGNINYEIAPGTDLTEYHYVLTWCRMFSVLFNSAHLA